jgi:Tol biopolymer transport system component
VWSADSTRLTFQSDRDGDASIYWQRADGTGVAERLTKAEPGVAHVPQSWSPDGAVLLFDAARGEEVTLLALKVRDRSIAPFGGVRSLAPSGAIVSPDGHWVAYSTRANLSSANVVYVQPFPATGALFQISKTSEDGHHQVWSRDRPSRPATR